MPPETDFLLVDHCLFEKTAPTAFPFAFNHEGNPNRNVPVRALIERDFFDGNNGASRKNKLVSYIHGYTDLGSGSSANERTRRRVSSASPFAR